MVKIIEEVRGLEAPEFVFAAAARERAAAEYAAHLRAVHERNRREESRANMANIACFFGGALIMAAFVLTGLYM